MEEPLKINDEITIPARELWFTASRSGGPGGQHVNKTSSRVTLHWNLDGSQALMPHIRARLLRRLRSRLSREGVVLLHVDEHRSQHRNREIARERLVEIVSEALVERKPRVPTKMSKSAKRKRLEKKRRRSRVKELRRAPVGRD